MKIETILIKRMNAAIRSRERFMKAAEKYNTSDISTDWRKSDNFLASANRAHRAAIKMKVLLFACEQMAIVSEGPLPTPV